MLGNGALVRAQLSFCSAWAAEWAFTVAISLVAFADGGATAVGLVGALRLLPAALLAPVIGALADRVPRERVLIGSSAVRGVATLAAAAVLAADGPVALVYALAVPSTIAFTPFRAAHSALLPSLCRTTAELTGANVVRGGMDSLSVVVGPLVAALLLSVADVWAVFAFAGAAGLVSAALLLALRYERLEPAADTRRLHDELRAGVQAIRTTPGLALAISLPVFQTGIRGALSVFLVVVAIDELALGESAVGTLQGVMGIGALVGSIAATRLVGSRALLRWTAIAVVFWGAPLIAVGALPREAVFVLALLVIGVANAVLDAAGFTAISRLAPDAVLARVFGVFESLVALAVAGGSLLTPLAIELLGTTGALIAIGALAPVFIAACWPRLARIDTALAARTDAIHMLQCVPMLRALPVAVIEQLARRLERVELRAGKQLFAAGDPGDRFYVVDSGSVCVLDGEREMRTMGPGEGFGEIAPLRDIPRTMTVRAAEDSVLRAISRVDFLPAITGFSMASREAATAVTTWLEHTPGTAAQP
jgi:MFS family permease